MPSFKQSLEKQDSKLVTEQLRRWGQGEENALDGLVAMVYPQLRRIAAHLMRNERCNHTLQASALVHEAFFKWRKAQHLPWQNRNHFMAIVVIAMKWVLMDYGRKHRRRPVLVQIPSGDLPPEPFAREMAVEDLLILNIALERLAAWDVRKARVMELRFFGGLTNEEIAQVLEIASNTVIKDVRCAEAWLYHEMAVIKDNDTDTMEDN